MSTKAAVIAVAAGGVAAAVAVGDIVDADVISVTSGAQSTRDLGTVAPGATLTPPVSFQLRCNGSKHVDNGQTVSMVFHDAKLNGAAAGSAVKTTTATIGAVPPSWPDDSSECGSATPMNDNGDATVTIVAPTTPGAHTVEVSYKPQFSPPATDDPSDITSETTKVSFTFTVAAPVTTDPDGDGVPNDTDNCDNVSNATQTDTDGDSDGDACDADDDNDTVADTSDNCRIVVNTDQTNSDSDSAGDACDADDDNDNVADTSDNCATTFNDDQKDTDGDKIGDVCDPDIDGDGAANGSDNCKFDANADQKDTDGDLAGDACDLDDDGDGVNDAGDNCPLAVNADQKDQDKDGKGTVCDTNDAAPAVGTAALDANGKEGDELGASGTFSDADGAGSLTISKKSGQGDVKQGADGSWTWSLKTTDDGSGTVEVQASDGEHTVVVDSFEWSAANVAPTKPGAPALAAGSTSPNNTGQYTLTWGESTDVSGDTVTYTLTAKDADDTTSSVVASGITSGSHTFGGANAVSEGTRTYEVKASDGEANGDSAASDPSSPVKVDKSAPSAPAAAATGPAGAPAANSDGWFKDQVTVTYAGSTDPALVDTSVGSGIAGYTAAQQFTTSGTHGYSGKATDNAGNDSAAATGSVMVDATAPTVAITGCPAAPVVLRSIQNVTVTATDAHSGLTSNPSGSVALDTSSVGAKTKSITVTDKVGHSSAATCNYSVVFDWRGFFQPIDNGGVYNQVTAGRTIPAKFSLGGDQGLGILAAGSPGSIQVPCLSGAPVDSVEESMTTTTSGLKYDPIADQYIYNWKTLTSYANTCRQLTVTLTDGTPHTALFKFTK